MILLYLLLAVLAVISVLLLICLVRACIHKKAYRKRLWYAAKIPTPCALPTSFPKWYRSIL